MKKTIIKNHQNIFKKLIFATIVSAALVSCGGGGGGKKAPATAASATLGFDIKTFRFTWTDVSDATFYRLMENPDGSSGFMQVGSDIAQGTQTVDHIVPLYNRVNASYVLQSCNVIGCTDGSAVNITGSLVDAIGYFKASNTDIADFFGYSVSLSDDGNVLAVGAFGEDSSTTGINTTPNELRSDSGAVYVYTRNDSVWSEQAYIKASNAGSNDNFGISISLNGDGSTLAVGAYREDSNTSGINTTPNNLAIDAGAVFVFERSNSTWSQQSFIKASNTGAGDFFGFSVSLNDDGNVLAVGAYNEDSSTTGINTTPDDFSSNAGAVYVYNRNGSTWSEQAYIKASNTNAGDFFGGSVSISDDGSIIAISASREDSNSNGINTIPDELALNSGAAYIYTLNGSTWSEQAYIKASNSTTNNRFGFPLSLSGDGNTLAVGASNENSDTSGINSTPNNFLSNNSGATYIYNRSGSTWSEQAYIKASNPDSADLFGSSVSLSNDGNTLAVGAIYEESDTIGINTTPNNLESLNGAAYTFTRSGGTWSEQAYIKPINTGTFFDFGTSLSFSGDGNTLAIGAHGEDGSTSGVGTTPDGLADSAGAVYLY